MSAREEQASPTCSSSGRALGAQAAGTLAVLGALALLAACTVPAPETPAMPPEVSPHSQPDAAPERLDSSVVRPMYTEILPIDLPTVVRVTRARSLDIVQARLRLEEAQGRVDSAAAALFPLASLGALFERAQGSTRAVQGMVVPVDFESFQPAFAAQLLLNPVRAAFDLVAARKSVAAAGEHAQAAEMEATHAALGLYYDLVLEQLRIAAARAEAAAAAKRWREETVKARSGVSVEIDVLVARADAGAAAATLVSQILAYERTSVALALALHLDATMTLVPADEAVPPRRLVDESLPVATLVDLALRFRPDLRALRTAAGVAEAEASAVSWSAAAPLVRAAVHVSGTTTEAAGEHFPLRDEERVQAGLSWQLDPAWFGRQAAADARERLALLDVGRKLDQIAAEVVAADRRSRAQQDLVALQSDRLAAALETERRIALNHAAGSATDLDVLISKAAAARARLDRGESVVRYDQAQIDLLAALGLLLPEAVGAGLENPPPPASKDFDSDANQRSNR